MVLERERFRRWILNAWEVLKCDAGEDQLDGEIKKCSQRVKEQSNIIQTINRRKANWTGHILGSNCLINHVIEGRVEEMIQATERRGRRRRQLLDYLKERDNTVN